MSEQLNDPDYDAVCKDLARCSFLVPEDYVLYRDDTVLFAEQVGGVQGGTYSASTVSAYEYAKAGNQC